MALQVSGVLLVIKEKREWMVNKDSKVILVFQDQEVMLEIKDHEEEKVDI